MQGQLTIVGVTQFKGDIDGRAYDQTKCLVMLPFPSTRGTAIGYDAIGANYGDSRNFDKFKSRDYPLVVDAEYELTTAGMEILAVKFPAPTQK